MAELAYKTAQGLYNYYTPGFKRRALRRYTRPVMRGPYSTGRKYQLNHAGQLLAGNVGAAVAGAVAVGTGKYLKSKKPSAKQEAKANSRKIRTIKKELGSNISVLTYRKRDTTYARCPQAESNTTDFIVNNIGSMEAVLSNVPFFDSATGALINTNLTDDSFTRNLMFKNIYANITLRNNCKVPVRLKLYLVSVKNDTDTTPTVAFTSGLVDCMATADPSSTQVFPTDSELFKDLWTIKKSISKYMQPGTECSMSHALKDITYDTALTDAHNLNHQKKMKTFGWMIRIEGVPAHDGGAPNVIVGSTAGQLDIIVDSKYTLHYDSGGQGLRRLQVVDNTPNLPTMVVSNKPIASNQIYKLTQDTL
nr:capsid protein [Mute swan feces associated circular virus 3]